MQSFFYKPGGPLSGYVDFFWLQTGYRPLHDKEKILPSGSIQLIINLEQKAFRIFEEGQAVDFSSVIVTGAQAKPVITDPGSRSSTLGVLFQPGGTIPLFNIAASELEAGVTNFSSIVGMAQMEKLYLRLMEASSIRKKFQWMEQFLTSKLNQEDVLHPAVLFSVEKLRASARPNSISELSEHAGLTPKRFTDVFHRQVGLTPKLFARICRFQHILSQIKAVETIDWANLALDFGYYDQSHLIRDFKSFSGMTPSEYFRLNPDEKNHIPL